MGKNLMRTAKYASSKDFASSACFGAMACHMVDARLTLASRPARSVLRPCRMVCSSIFKIRRVRTVGAFKQSAVAFSPALADGPH
jgi:hypothetical protein